MPEILVVQSCKVSGSTCRRVQRVTCLLYDKGRKSTEKSQPLNMMVYKLFRIIFAILKNGMDYDSEKMLRDIRRERKCEAIAT